MADSILGLKHITKIFPGIRALDDVEFDLREGEIHALIGENGAGKSTLINVIMGVFPSESGEIWLKGKHITIANPNIAKELGIAAIFQHVTAYSHLSVAENIFLGHEYLKKPFNTIDWKRMNAEAAKILRRLGSDIDPMTPMGNLSVAKQQLVEISKALSWNAKILIMDEPTAALSKQESEELYEIALDLKRHGTSIIFVSHKFEDIRRLADRVTVFRDSKYIGTWQNGELDDDELMRRMVGREITQMFPQKTAALGKTVLKVDGLCRTGYFMDISFELREGEVLGLTGLVGAGRTEIAECVYGIERADAGTIEVYGKQVSVTNSKRGLSHGIGLLPEDRQREGLIMPWSIADNITLSALKQFASHGFILKKQIFGTTKKFAEKFEVKAKTVYDTADSLSGGNQQKVIFSRLLAQQSRILILDEPTKGIDVGSKASIYAIMEELAQQGYAILMISSEMPEIMGMCDRIMVMREGRISAVLTRSEASPESIIANALPTVRKA